MLAAAAVTFLAVAIKVGELLATRPTIPRDPPAVTAAAAAAAASAAAYAYAVVTVTVTVTINGTKGSYERYFRNALKIVDHKAHLGELELKLVGHTEAAAAKEAFSKALLSRFDVRLQNPAYGYLQVADFRRWEAPIVCPTEADKVVATEKIVSGCCPTDCWSPHTFWVGKEEIFPHS